jgi:polyferredoxin
VALCIGISAAIAFFAGRKWCAWICPRGSFLDIFIKPISREKKIPDFLKNLRFRMIVLVILMGILSLKLTAGYPDLNKMGMVFIQILVITTIAAVILGIIFHQRAWCYMCPVGTLAHIIGKGKKNIEIMPERCTDCGLCEKNCPMQVKPNAYKSKKVLDNADCTKCGVCISVCPEKALKKSAL